MHYLQRCARTLLTATLCVSAASLGDVARAQPSVEAFYKGDTINL